MLELAQKKVLCKRIYGVSKAEGLSLAASSRLERRENRVTHGDRPKRIIRFRDEARNEHRGRTVIVDPRIHTHARKRMIY